MEDGQPGEGRVVGQPTAAANQVGTVADPTHYRDPARLPLVLTSFPVPLFVLFIKENHKA
jgi:hypothetical protein